MMTDDERRKMIANMPDDAKERAAELYDMILSATEHANKYQAMTNEELAAAVINGPWAELPMFSQYSELLDAVADRLKKIAGREIFVPVIDKLPPEGVDVEFMQIHRGTRHGKQWLDNEAECAYRGITHWRPLPEPPAGEDE